MPDIEERLRTGLATLAADAPRSVHPRAELDRRLTTRRRTRGRAPILAAAAAAVVVGAVAVPIALSQGPEDGGLAPATSQDRPPTTAPAVPDVSAYLEPPQPITSAGAGADQVHLGLGLNKDRQFCFLVLDAGERPLSEAVCEPLPTWSANEVVTSRSLAELATRLRMPPVLEQEVADQMVFITAPEVVRLDVVNGNGDGPVNPSGGWTSAYYWSLADFNGPSDGFGYAAYDVDNKLLEQAIT